MTRLQLLEEITREEESKLHDRYTIGHTNGLKACVLYARTGDSLDNLASKARIAHSVRGQRDAYDTGFLDAIDRAKRILHEAGQEALRPVPDSAPDKVGSVLLRPMPGVDGSVQAAQERVPVLDDAVPGVWQEEVPGQVLRPMPRREPPPTQG